MEILSKSFHYKYLDKHIHILNIWLDHGWTNDMEELRISTQICVNIVAKLRTENGEHELCKM